MPPDVSQAGGEQPVQAMGTGTLLVERERDVFRLREEISRSTDAQATAVTAASLAVAAVAVGGDLLEGAESGWIFAAGVFLLLSAIAGGISRFPAPPPPKALLRKSERERVLNLYGTHNPTGSPATGKSSTIRQLGRDLGKAIGASETEFRRLTLETPKNIVEQQLLRHWRARSSLARYRMHSKSAWLSLSLVLLYLALLLATASVL